MCATETKPDNAYGGLSTSNESMRAQKKNEMKVNIEDRSRAKRTLKNARERESLGVARRGKQKGGREKGAYIN